jgi:hypothetical protein
MTLILKALGAISALILVVIALFSSLIAVGGILLTAIKFAIIVMFLVLLGMILLAILRDRTRRRREAQDI